jgi:hypothetical protein
MPARPWSRCWMKNPPRRKSGGFFVALNLLPKTGL